MISGLISLQEASQTLGVSVSTLLEWNDNNILKPTITPAGEVGYRDEQVRQFLTLRKPSPPVVSKPTAHSSRPSTILAFFTSFILTTVSTFSLLQFLPNFTPSSMVLSSHTSYSNLPESITPTIADLANSPSSEVFQDYTDTVNFASANTTSDSVFDQDGNIKGEISRTGVLAASIFGTNTMLESSPSKQNFDPTLIFAFFVLVLLSLPFAFKNSPKPIPGSNQKILEINQKTDGTVILSFQDQELKICKPELDSESDQFIERLMQLVTPGTKEIDYDSTKDNTISLSTPLSKIVTRLGFVGIKRDLFFPRTSKTRVLFRKYLTSHDLAAMNLSLDQIFPRTSQV